MVDHPAIRAPPKCEPTARRSTPTACNASSTTTKQKMRPVNPFLPITRNVESERLLRHGPSGNGTFTVSLFMLRFLKIILVFPVHECHAFVTSNYSPYRGTLFANDGGESIGRAELGLLTFDLDDTLFPIDETVMDANARQLQCMNQILISACNRPALNITEHDFQNTMYEVRKNISDPISYSDLRKLTIRNILLEDEFLKNEENVDGYVDKAFDAWLQERHIAAERYLFPEALATLQELKKQYPDICIAAITNGRGNPLHMKYSLAPFFDFCISGEDEHVFPHRKPSPKIFELAIERYRKLYPHHSSLSERIWCHVGDCLINDVGASAACGAYAIWFCPNETSVANGQNPSVSLAGLRNIPSLETTSQKISVRVTNLSQLPAAIKEFVQQPERCIARALVDDRTC